MKQAGKRFLSLLLVVSMLFGMMIFPVSAAEVDETVLPEQSQAVESSDPQDASAEQEESDHPGILSEEEEEVLITGAETENIVTAAAVSGEAAEQSDETAEDSSQEDSRLHGGETISVGGSYQLAFDATGVITIATDEPVTIVGNGAAWDESCTMTSTPNSGLSIDCTVAGANLTIQDLYINGAASGYNAIDFMGTGNRLTLSGVNLLDNNMDYDYGVIHVPTGGSLTIGGEGTVYIYKSAGGAAIGGDTGEVNGDIVINSGNIFAKGSKPGATIGSGQSAIGGAVTINGGNVYAMSNARGSCIGGGGYTGGVVGEGGAVTVNGGTIMLVVDWTGAAVGGGGGNNSSQEQDGGTLIINGGSVKARINSNAYGSWNVTAGSDDEAYQINDIVITAEKLNGSNAPVSMLTLPLDAVAANASGSKYTVKVDNALFYTGNGYTNTYDRQTSGTVVNWPAGDPENSLYLYLTPEDHILEVNGKYYTASWDAEAGAFTLTGGKPVDPYYICADALVDGVFTITESGATYTLEEGVTASVVVAAGVKDAVIVGNGVVYNADVSSVEYGAISSTPVCITIDAAAAPGVHLTLQDVYNSIDSSTYTTNMIDFSGDGNRLTIKGTCLLDYDIGFKNSGNAGIHVAMGTSLTIDGDGTLYMYKNSQGAGIGGATREMNGELTFAMTGCLYIKGTKQGAVIGAGSGASSATDAPGAVTFESGNYNIITNSRGAAIGGSAGAAGGSTGTVVNVKPGATLSINTDYSGAAIGGGGYAQGNDSSGGTMYVYGGSIRPYVDKNAASNVTTGWNGRTLTEGVNDAIITARRLDGEGNEVYMCVADLTEIAATADGLYGVKIDGGETYFYNGAGHSCVYALDGIDRSTEASGSPLTTIGNWIPEQDTNLYLYLTGEDHKIDINGTTVTYYWDEVHETFSTVDKAVVTFAVTPADATIVVSDGIGYTYLENTHEGRFFEAVEGVEADEENGIEAVEARSAMTKFSLVPGEYTVTITKDGYYASSTSFKVSEDLHAVSINAASNVNSYLKDDLFTIPMSAFIKSSNEGAWDGVTIDVSWYSEMASEMHISTPAQLAGMAAIVNGIYNAEITTIIDDVDGDGVTETYTPSDYAHLEGCKIIPANSIGTSGGNNQLTTSTYWYGAKSKGTYTSGSDELALPADFNGQTVYIDNDLDMGGHQVDGVWTGARYMTIGGQSLMHYIDYSVWKSDGYSHIGASFNGTLDGQGHIIQNLYCDRYADGTNWGDSASVGLIGRLGNHDSDPADIAAVDPTVRNIAVAGYIYGRRSVGGIVGKTGHTSASMVIGDTSTGVIIENCLNFAEIRNTDAKGIGGICGAGWNDGVIRNCANFGEIYAGRQNGGGICGSCEVSVINCYNIGYVGAVSYSQGQAIGTDNGGAVYTNVYWLTGSSIADSVDTYQYPAVYRHDSKDTLYEIESFEAFSTTEFLANINDTTRQWVIPAETDGIWALLSGVSFSNCKLDTTGVSAAGFPVPRCFIKDATALTSIDKTADPSVLEYISGQSFDTTGLEIWAAWSDGTKELVTDYVVSPAGALSTADTSVTVSGSRGGSEYSYSFAITVAANEINEIKFKTKPNNMLYASDEDFDPTGMTITAYYTNFPTTAVTLEAEDYTAAFVQNEEGGCDLVVSYTYDGKTVTVSEAVTILDTPAPAANAEGFYELGCTNDVLWFANQVNKLKNTAINGKLTADVTMPESFVGIGISGKSYAGTFDGADHTVTLSTSISSGGCALFGNVSGAVISNVIVDGSVTSGNTSSGIAGLVAFVYTDGVTITNCVNKADIKGTGYVGGIVGKVMNSKAPVTISSCRNEGTITATDEYAGGIAGYMAYYSSGTGLLTVSGCTNTGAIASAAAYNVGGIVGHISGSKAEQYVLIENCGNEGAVTGMIHVGGIVGYSKTAYDQIDSCYNASSVRAAGMTGIGGVGGIVGYANSMVDSCYNLGTVSSTGSNNQYSTSGLGVGGIIGASNGATLKNCYNAGELNGDSAISDKGDETLHEGALVGYINYKSTTCANSYYLADGDLAAYGAASGEAATFDGDAASKTSEELRALAVTLGDAYAAGHPCFGDGYPVLVWQVGTAVPATYTVTIPESGEGYTVSIDDGCTTTVVEGSEFRFSIYTLEGYKIVSVKAGETELTAVSGLYTIADITSDVAVTIEVIYGDSIENPFVDVIEGQYYYEPVLWAVKKGITTGLAPTVFGVDKACTRAQFVTFLWRAAGSPEPTITTNPFTDVAEGEFYSKAVLWAVENGITTGLNATTFGINDPCTRDQVVTFLWRYAGSPDPTSRSNPFTDVAEGQYYSDAIAWAVENGITTGMTATVFGVGAACNRAMVVTFLYRAMTK